MAILPKKSLLKLKQVERTKVSIIDGGKQRQKKRVTFPALQELEFMCFILNLIRFLSVQHRTTTLLILSASHLGKALATCSCCRVLPERATTK
jgi:hypothetical protein